MRVWPIVRAHLGGIEKRLFINRRHLVSCFASCDVQRPMNSHEDSGLLPLRPAKVRRAEKSIEKPDRLPQRRSAEKVVASSNGKQEEIVER
jgi:hypothetical protein